MFTVNIKQFSNIIEETLKAKLKHSILGIGAPGIGKSEVIKEIAERNGYRLVDLRLAMMSETEIAGLIFPSADKTYTEWLRPDWFPTGKEGKPTVLLLDEITSAPKRNQVAAYQLVLDRRIGSHILPDDTVIIALGNGEEDGGVYVEMAAPLANRFEIYNIEMSAKIWLEYAQTYRDKNTGLGVNPFVIAYISEHPGDLHTQKQNSEEMVFASPRSWMRVSETLNTFGLNNPVAVAKYMATLGEVLGGQFHQYCAKYANNHIVDEIWNGENPPAPTTNGDILYCIASLQNKYANLCNDSSVDAKEKRAALTKITTWSEKLPSEYHTVLLTNITSVDFDVVGDTLNEAEGEEILKGLEQVVMKEEAIEEALQTGGSVSEAIANVAEGFGAIQAEEDDDIVQGDSFYF